MDDAAPVNPGHKIIFLKKHVESFFDARPDEFQELSKFIISVKDKLNRKYHPDGYTIGINEGRAAGRSIDHLHIHLIPRYFGDVKNPRGGVRNVMDKRIPPKIPKKI